VASSVAFSPSRQPLGTPYQLPLTAITHACRKLTLNSGATVLKYKLFNRLLLTADILFRLNNNGLRQNVTSLVALSYAFGQ
jgi:hypothetical protein